MHPAFEKLYKSNKRYFFITGGRGSLKSVNAHEFAAKLTFETGHGILFTRYTMKSAETSIIPEFIKVINRLGLGAYFHITKTRVINKTTGSFILFSGIKTNSGDQTANLKSISGITTWIIEEGEDFLDELAFDTIDDSIRTIERQNRVIWIQNPSTKEHFIYKRWILPSNKKIKVEGFDVTVSNVEEVEHIHTTYRIAEKEGYLVQSWLDKAHKSIKKMEDEIFTTTKSWDKSKEELEHKVRIIKHTCHYYYNYIGGWLEKAVGVIFDNWIEGEFDSSIPFLHALDYGYSPDPLAVGTIALNERRKRIYVKDRIYATEVNDIPAALEEVGVMKKELIVCDTNEKRTTAAIKKKGYNIQRAIKNSVAEDIREIKQYLIIVDPSSSNFKAELNNYAWNDKKASIPIGEYNHLMDGMRYGYRRLKYGLSKHRFRKSSK